MNLNSVNPMLRGNRKICFAYFVVIVATAVLLLTDKIEGWAWVATVTGTYGLFGLTNTSEWRQYRGFPGSQEPDDLL